MKPPFHADHVGKSHSAKSLIDSRTAHLDNKLSAEQLKRAEDDVIIDLITMQERVGSMPSRTERRVGITGAIASLKA